MPDAFGNLTVFEKVRDQEALSSSEDPNLETIFDVSTWAKNPEARKWPGFDRLVNKDVTMANLDKLELDDVRELAEIANECTVMDLTDDADFFQLKLSVMCASSLAKGGLAQKLTHTIIRNLNFGGDALTAAGGPKPQGEPFWRKFVPKMGQVNK